MENTKGYPAMHGNVLSCAILWSVKNSCYSVALYCPQSASADALQELVRQTLLDPINKQIRFEVGAVFCLDIDNNGKSRGKLETSEQDRTFPMVDIFINEILPTDEGTEKISDVLESVKDPTCNAALTDIVRTWALVKSARLHKITHVLLPDCREDVACRALSAVVLGRGGALPTETKYTWEIFSDLSFVRPMRELSKHDIDALLASSKDEEHSDISETQHRPQTLQQTSSSFLLEREDLAASACAMIRLGEKLSGLVTLPNEDASPAEKICNFDLKFLYLRYHFAG